MTSSMAASIQGRFTPLLPTPFLLLFAAAAGGLHTLTFAPTPHGGWLQMATFALTFALITQASNGYLAALTAGIFGFAHFASGLFWLYISLHVYGDLSIMLALAALAVFVLYLALYPALAAALWHVCLSSQSSKTGWRSSLVFASAWMLTEWLRGTVLTGFPWLANGYAQVDGPFAGYAAIVGVYGVSGLLVLSSALLVQASAAAASRQWRTALLPAVTVLLLIGGGLAATKIAWTKPIHAPLTVRLLQGNVKQAMKFEPIGIEAAIQRYQSLITAGRADLILTPETALPMVIHNLPLSFVRAVHLFSANTHSAVMLGAVGTTTSSTGQTHFTNSLFGISPDSATVYRYDKTHLVPFGEFVPLGFRWLVQRMKIPLGDFARGAIIQQPFTVQGQSLAFNICSEDLFGEEIARTLRLASTPGNILVNASNFAWYGDTIVLDQSLQIARMRALETGRPMLRATNTGTTAAIDADGRVIARLPAFTVGALAARVQGRTGTTPYIAYGNMPALLLALIVLAGFALHRALKS
jgi:apolipoprotein N-acyltransferase